MSRICIRLPQGEWFFDDARRLGNPGGFGEVFEGEGSQGNAVAVKRLKITAADAAHRELAIASELARRKLTHVIVPLDSGQDADSGGYFVVMPRAERSLGDVLVARGPLPIGEAVQVLQQIVAGLQEVADIVHRDLKPANVLLHEQKWKIADFGIARFVEDATSLNTLRGALTPQFAAPEQWNLERATSATDVYALGCTVHVLVSGAPPFRGPGQDDYRQQHLSADPPRLEAVDPRLRALVSASLRTPPTGRPTLRRFAEVLQDIASRPAAPPASLAALQAANAKEAERVSQGAAEAARAVQAKRKRDAIIATGESILREIFQELMEVARQHASESRIESHLDSLIVRMGANAGLAMRLEGAIPPNATFPNSRWAVMAIGRIDVQQGPQSNGVRVNLRLERSTNEWKHGATLWYMSLPPAEGYRWYEVSYKGPGV